MPNSNNLNDDKSADKGNPASIKLDDDGLPSVENFSVGLSPVEETPTDSESISETHSDQEPITPVSATEEVPPTPSPRVTVTVTKDEEDEEDIPPASWREFKEGTPAPFIDRSIENGFKMEWIPVPMQPVVKAISEYALVDIAMASLVVDSVTSHAIGKGIGIRNKSIGKDACPNIMTIFSMLSGSGKSDAIDWAMRFLEDCFIEAGKQHARNTLVDDKFALKRQEKLIEDLEKFEELDETQQNQLDAANNEKLRLENKIRPPKFLLEDFTIAMAEESLCQNNGMISVASSEARATIDNLLGLNATTGTKGVTQDSVYLKCFGQERITTGRLSRESEQERCTMVSTVAVQPDKFQRMLYSTDLRDSGFIPRHLIYASNEHKDGEEKKIPDKVAKTFGTFIREVFNAFRIDDTYKSKDKTTWVLLQSQQEEILRNYKKFIDREIKSSREFLTLSAKRLVEYSVKVAGIHHVMYHGSRAEYESLDDLSLTQAIDKVEWYFKELQKMTRYAEGKAKHEKEERLLVDLLDLARRKGGMIQNRNITKAGLAESAAEAESIIESIGKAYFEIINEGRDGETKGRQRKRYVLKDHRMVA